MRKVIVRFKGAGRYPLLKDFIKADAEYTANLYRRQIYEEGIDIREEHSDTLLSIYRTVLGPEGEKLLRENLAKAFMRHAMKSISVDVEEDGNDITVTYTVSFAGLLDELDAVLERLPKMARDLIKKQVHSEEEVKEMERNLANEIKDAVYSDYIDQDLSRYYPGVEVEVHIKK